MKLDNLTLTLLSLAALAVPASAVAQSREVAPAPKQPPTADAGQLRVKPNAVVPVVFTEKAYYIPLQHWLDEPLPNEEAIRKTVESEFASGVTKVKSVPDNLARLQGKVVTAFDAKGKTCEVTLTEFAAWGLMSDASETALLAKVTPKGKCVPFAVAQSGKFAVVPAVKGTAAETKAVRAAFGSVAGYTTRDERKRFTGAPKITFYVDNGFRWAIAKIFRKTSQTDGCGYDFPLASALFSIDAAGAATVVGDLTLGDEKFATIDTNGDGALEVISGSFYRDHGMRADVQLSGYFSFGKAPVTQRIVHSHYVGCD